MGHVPGPSFQFFFYPYYYVHYYIAAYSTPAPTAIAPNFIGGGVRCAPPFEVDVEVVVAAAPVCALPSPAYALTALGTGDASGTDAVPVPISKIWELVALKFVCAMEISLLLRSYTRYADLMNVSPSTDVLDPAGDMPKRQASVPSAKVAGLPELDVTGITSSFIGTEMVGEEKVKSRVVELYAREHGTYAAPAAVSYCACTSW